MISFFVKGEPVAKQSFRYATGGGYTPQNVKNWETEVGYHASINVVETLSCPVKVELKFALSTRRRVDLDNLSKAVLDGMKGIAFKDDSQVVELKISKCVNKEKPGVMVMIEQVKGE